jgi:ubiquinone/menaquinone biosynthesis C-methylase UbiE
VVQLGAVRRSMKSNTEWKKWGQVDPLYAVATWKGKEKGGPSPWTDAEFYALGRSDWEDFLAQWKTFGCNPGHCIEIGCGAGRLTRHLAETFQSVTGLDVSEDQIAYAQSRIDRPNIVFRVTDGVQFPSGLPSATAVFSAHVFQHFDAVSDAERVFREVFRVLSPGGTLMIHLPIHSLPKSPLTPFLRRALAAIKFVGTLKANFDRKRGKLIMRGLSYEKSWLADTLTVIGFQRIEFRTFRVHSNHDWHDFVLAEKLPDKPASDRH